MCKGTSWGVTGGSPSFGKGSLGRVILCVSHGSIVTMHTIYFRSSNELITMQITTLLTAVHHKRPLYWMW